MQTATIAGVPVVKIGHGLMLMTWIPTPPPEEQCFAAIKAGIDNAPPGVKVFLNSGEFYGVFPNGTANLELLNRFFTKYPEYADRTSLSVKGGLSIDAQGFHLDSSAAGLERSINNIIEKLGPNKKVDLFECARRVPSCKTRTHISNTGYSSRVDPQVPTENVIATLNKYVESGKIGAIGMSECSAATLERAGKVGKVAVVEIEVSPWSFEEETWKVIDKAAEMGTVVAAYSPLGSGFLTGKLKVDELEKGDLRTHIPRLEQDAVQKNMNIVTALTEIADKKGVTPAQLCLAWVSALGPHVVPIPGSSRAERTLENMAAASIVLSQEELDEIKRVLEANPVHGLRTSQAAAKFSWS